MKVSSTIIAALVSSALIWFMSRDNRSSDSGKTLEKASRVYKINTKTWTPIVIGTRRFDIDIVPRPGPQLSWFIVANDVTNKVHQMPRPNGDRIDLGYSVKRVYVALVPGQYVQEAEVMFQEK